MEKRILISSGVAIALALSAGIMAAPAFADTSSTTAQSGTHTQRQKPAAFGTVASISGDTITLTSKLKTAATTYTVDATNATVTKGIGKSATAIAVSGILVGDRLVVQGTVSGTNITATAIRDGLGDNRIGKKPMIRGVMGGLNGRFAAGSVTAVNGSTFTVQPKAWGKNATTTPAAITVTTDSTTTYKKDGATATLADVVSGANVFVVGTKDSTTGNVVAKMVSVVTKLPTEGPRGMHPKKTAQTAPTSS